MTIDLNKLEQAAKEATPGPWTAFIDDDDARMGTYHIAEHCIDGIDEQSNAEFMTLANPATILALVRIVRAAKDLCNTDDGRPSDMVTKLEMLCDETECVE